MTTKNQTTEDAYRAIIAADGHPDREMIIKTTIETAYQEGAMSMIDKVDVLLSRTNLHEIERQGILKALIDDD